MNRFKDIGWYTGIVLLTLLACYLAFLLLGILGASDGCQDDCSRHAVQVLQYISSLWR